MNEEEEIKFNKRSALEVSRVVETYVDGFGRTIKKVKKEIHKEPLDLGSINEPKNEDIVEFRYLFFNGGVYG